MVSRILCLFIYFFVYSFLFTCFRAQKIHSGSDAVSLDLAHPPSKQPDSTTSVKSWKRIGSNMTKSHSQSSRGSSNSDHSISTGLPQKTVRKGTRSQDGVHWEDSQKSGSRPESLSPNVPMAGQSRGLDLSQRSTMSASSDLASPGDVDSSGVAVSMWKELSVDGGSGRSEEGSWRNGDMWEADPPNNHHILSGESERSEEAGGKGVVTPPNVFGTGDQEGDRGRLSCATSSTFPCALQKQQEGKDVGHHVVDRVLELSQMQQLSVDTRQQPLPLDRQSEIVLGLAAEVPSLTATNRPERRHGQEVGGKDGDSCEDNNGKDTKFLSNVYNGMFLLMEYNCGFPQNI